MNAPAPIVTASTNPNQPKIWEAKKLKDIVDEYVDTDPRFLGLSRYIVNVRFFWSTLISTACAGHGFIFFNPDFYESIPEGTRKTVVAHEVWHLILKHLERGEGLDPVTDNIAGDHVINIGLQDDGFTFEGTNPCLDVKYRGQSKEQIYNAIWAERKKNPQKPGEGYVSRDTILDHVQTVLDADAQGKTLEQQKEENDKAIDNAAPGMTAGHQDRILQNSNTKTVIVGASYKDIFQPYLVDPLSGGNRTFMRPNRRTHGLHKTTGLMLPGRLPRRGHINRLTHLVYALDVSGSISAKMAQQFQDSVRTIKELLNPAKLTVMLFDTRVVYQKTFTDKEKYTKIAVKAGGGTDLKDVYKKTEELNPEALVIFTDLCVGIPPEPKWDTIWLVPYQGVHIPPNLYGEVYLIQ